MKNLNKIIKTAEHFKEIHSEEVSSIGFQTIIEMLKKSETLNIYSLYSLKKEVENILIQNDLYETSYINITAELSFDRTEYKLSTGIGIYIRDCKTPISLLKALEKEISENKDKILEEIAQNKEDSNIDLK